MANIVFASSKGGAGKTTAALVLTCALARQAHEKGLEVALVDADPNQHSAAWAHLPGKPANVIVYENINAETILEAIEEAQNRCAFVVVDLEGVASSAVIGALSRADLVIVPCQPSQNDGKEAAKTIKTIKYAGKVSNRVIPHAVLFSRMSAAIMTKTYKHLSAELTGAGVDVFDVSLIDREAFRNILAFGGSVDDLEASSKSEQASINKAADNARAFAAEVKIKLKESFDQRRAMNG